MNFIAKFYIFQATCIKHTPYGFVFWTLENDPKFAQEVLLKCTGEAEKLLKLLHTVRFWAVRDKSKQLWESRDEIFGCQSKTVVIDCSIRHAQRQQQQQPVTKFCVSDIWTKISTVWLLPPPTSVNQHGCVDVVALWFIHCIIWYASKVILYRLTDYD